MTSPTGMSRRAVLGGLTGLAAVATIPALATAAHAERPRAVPRPTFYSCADWGARPPNGTPQYIATPPNKIVVHHTAFPNVEDYSLEYAFQNSRDIQDLHMDQNGWMDSGQHFTNSRGGYLTEGRHGSLDALSAGDGMVQGAHCVGQNTQAIGIENDGSYHLGDPVPQAQWDSLIAFCAFVCSQYGIPAQEIYGHQDFNSTLCPGGIQDRLPELRDAVQAVLNG
ncbi:N-acetylmuramoyl-L-alanine amidase [Stackebrandtia albiflava]|uniref:N-acetylmuramoyl-L-alanine amidase n=1 Tax=Stackebrandtia albiflava TaxID=406432 RepID=A0A562V9N8_9ACTN|nr:peptidoglycan recognition family protein [Stackebrandtia albiflava]TWJ14599.1 N-acetylmuramoyl-L-alanine amidase [Stackebrandtia albiflava]